LKYQETKHQRLEEELEAEESKDEST